jgi:ABC-2 type transport system ATP-binding protein
MNAIAISNLQFSYPGQASPVFSGLDLNIREGSSFGIFGPNGAGKTTLIHCMTGLLKYRTGSIKMLGQELKSQPKKIREYFGFVPQDFSLYMELNAFENLMFFGAWAGLDKQTSKSRAIDLLGILGLSDVMHRQLKYFSGGMKRRVNLAIGVMHQPKILFLDEPTVGVDIHSRQALIAYLEQLKLNGTTLIYTSHQLSEAEEICDDIALFDEGRIIAHDHLHNLLKIHQHEDLEGLFLQLTGKKFRDA